MKNRKWINRRKTVLAVILAAGILLQGEPAQAQETAGSTAAAVETQDVNDDNTTAGVASFLKADNKTTEEYIAAAKDLNSGYGYEVLGIANTEDNNLNIRETPSTEGRLVGKLPRYAACEVLKIENGWAHITSGKVEGYVSMDYLATGMEAKKLAAQKLTLMATVTCDALRVREEPNTDAPVITQIPNGEQLEVAEEEGEWVRVYLDDEEVYVAAAYVKVEEKLEEAITMTELLYGQGVSDVRVDLVQYAKQFLGNPYVWGGTSLTRGADCSGFVLSIFKKYGYNLPHSSVAQGNSGRKITMSELKPGDLVLYGKNGSINHVAIYIGNGQVIHASSPKTGIKISSYNYRTPVKAVRVIND